jgi:peptidoglycan/xylan/chitin deacetylase (PgdA/CDA1 family)
MTATVFLAAGRIGGVADWDESYGPPAALLTAEEIRELRDEGVDFGAHGVSHRPMTGLSTEELVREALRSRAVLERHLRLDTRAPRTVTALAYPYGDQDGIVRLAMRDCGFNAGFATWPGMARIDGDPMNVPRIEIARDDDLAAFAAKLGL